MLFRSVDMNGFIDNCGNYGADGIVGPHHEKEGSYFTIKQVWCPIQIRVDSLDSQFDGKLRIENRYDFLNANTCRFTYKYVQLPSVTDRGGMKVMKQGEVNCPDIPAHGVGTLTIPAAMKGANALLLTVTDKRGRQSSSRLLLQSHSLLPSVAEMPDRGFGRSRPSR